jgi:gliding motility-associated protein GldM
MSGDHYEAEIFLAAFDTTQKPEIFIGEYDSTTMEMKGELGKDYIKLDSITQDGKGIYKVSEGVGYHEVKGIIHSKTKDKILKFPFNNEYQVAQGSVVISPTKMNVFYIGVENPVEISVPGVAMDKIFPSISGGGGSLRKAQKGYIVTVSSPTNDCNISVGAEINGNRRSMGSMKFRVKRVPDPVAMVAGQKGGDIAKTKLVSQTGVSAVLENFDFDLKFNIVKFTVSANIDGFTQDAPCSGSRFSPKALEIMQKQKRGQKVYIEDVMAKGPDGTTRKLGTLTFKLQ